MLEAALGDAEQAEQPQDLVSAVLLDHLVLEGVDDLLELFAQDDLLLESIGVRVVDVLHLVVNVESQVYVVSQDVLSLRNVHVLDLCNVGFGFIDRLWRIFLFDDTLDLLHLLTESALKRVEVLVPHVLEDLVVIRQREDLSLLLWSSVFLGVRLDDRSLYLDRAAANPEKLV